MQFATGECWLQHITRIHGAFGLTGADHGVDFVDEENDLAFFGRDVFEHGLQALFELATVLGTRQ